MSGAGDSMGDAFPSESVLTIMPQRRVGGIVLPKFQMRFKMTALTISNLDRPALYNCSEEDVLNSIARIIIFLVLKIHSVVSAACIALSSSS